MSMLIAAAITLNATATLPAGTAPSADVALLARHKIPLTAAGVSGYLKNLRQDPATRTRTARLIAQLADSKYQVRESAMKALISGASVDLDLIRKAAQSTDPETASRARRILRHPKTLARQQAQEERRDVVAAILRVVRHRSIEKTAAAIVESAPQMTGWGVESELSDAVAVVAEKPDGPLLERALQSKSVLSRVAAIRGYGRIAGARGRKTLRGLMRDAQPDVVLEAAHALAEQSQREALPGLVRLISSRSVRVRARSVQILRAWTAKNHGFNPFRPPARQKDAQRRWATWIASHGKTAPLYVPIRLKPPPEDLATGLVLHYTFDRGTGTKIEDVSGHKRTAATARRVSRSAVAGRGEVLQLFGQGHHGSTGGHALLPFIDFNGLKQLTVALWVRETGMSHSEGEAYLTFGVDTGVSTAGALGIAHFNSYLCFRVGGGQITTPFVRTDRGRWVHYAMTFRNGRLKAFRNGRLVGETKARIAVKGRRAALGRHWWGGGAGTSTRFQGFMDDVRIYQRTLTPQQIQMLAVAPKAGKKP